MLVLEQLCVSDFRFRLGLTEMCEEKGFNGDQ